MQPSPGEEGGLGISAEALPGPERRHARPRPEPSPGPERRHARPGRSPAWDPPWDPSIGAHRLLVPGGNA